jgi:hypothetical protein
MVTQEHIESWFRRYAPNVKYTIDPTKYGLLVTADFGYRVRINSVDIMMCELTACLTTLGQRVCGG